MRLMISPEEFPQWLLMLSAIAIAPATAYAAYTFLRNQDLGTIPRDELNQTCRGLQRHLCAALVCHAVGKICI